MQSTSFTKLGVTLLFSSTTLLAQSLVKDINANPGAVASSSPTNFLTVGAVTYFSASDGYTGAELWKTDGTAAGTVLVKDINPGSGGSSPATLTLFGGFVYFSATDGVAGFELWRTNGTATGTTLVKDCFSGSGSSTPQNLLVRGGTLFFSAQDGTATVGTGRELWKTDGTTAGTAMIADLFPGPGSGIVSPVTSSFALFGTGLLFPATSGTTAPATGEELWFTDGTAAGTVQVSDIFVGTASSAPRFLTPFGGKVYFTATNGTTAPATGVELWATDGTAAGTTLVQDIWPGASGSIPSQPIVSAGKMYFAANDGTATTGSGRELWVSNGTAAGTVLVTDLNPGTASGVASAANLMVPFGTGVLVGMTNGTSGEELWFSDGTAAGTVVVADLQPGTGSSTPRMPRVAGSRVFFAATTAANGYEMYVTNGTSAGTSLTRDINPGTAAGVTNAVPSEARGSSLVFAASDGTINPARGTELYVSDGTAAGTVLIKDIAPTQPGNANPVNVAALGGLTVFAATDGVTGVEPWITDGTAARTTLLRDINPLTQSSSPANFTVLGSICFFTATDGTAGVELWKTDGTTAGTSLVLDIEPGTESSSPNNLVVANGKLFFNATTTAAGTELWISDGTVAGTKMVIELWPGQDSGTQTTAQAMIPFGNGVMFSGTTPANGPEICVSDGTAAGTRSLDFVPGVIGCDPAPFIVMNGYAFCNATDGASGFELVRSDGTLTGTALVRDIVPGSAQGNPGPFAVLNNRLFFFASDPANGTELWTSDGTTAGTQLVKDINPGSTGSVNTNIFGANLITAGDRLFFPANDGTRGVELWVSDGTAAGTALTRDLNPGLANGMTGLTAFAYAAGLGRKVLFNGNDGLSGQEPYVSDGSAAGTTLVADVFPGAAGSAPGQFLVNTQASAVYFPALTDTAGRELYSLSAASLGAALLESYGVGCPRSNGRIPRILAGVPTVDNSTFATTVEESYGPSTGILFVASAKANLPASGCTVLIDLTLPHVPIAITTNALGASTNPLPIPANPALIGASVFFQYLIRDPSGTFFAAATLSGGLRAQIGGP